MLRRQWANQDVGHIRTKPTSPWKTPRRSVPCKSSRKYSPVGDATAVGYGYPTRWFSARAASAKARGVVSRDTCLGVTWRFARCLATAQGGGETQSRHGGIFMALSWSRWIATSQGASASLNMSESEDGVISEAYRQRISSPRRQIQVNRAVAIDKNSWQRSPYSYDNGSSDLIFYKN